MIFIFLINYFFAGKMPQDGFRCRRYLNSSFTNLPACGQTNSGSTMFDFSFDASIWYFCRHQPKL
jgi:hypothetical protein